MLRLHTENLDPEAVRRHLDKLLQQGHSRRPRDPRPAPPARSLARRVLRRWEWARRLYGGLQAWRLSGWSLRWLVLRTPVFGKLAWRVWGAITGRGFKLHVLGELGRLGHGNQELHYRLVQLEEALRESRENERQRAARMAADLALLEARVTRLGAELQNVEGRPAAAASPLFQAWYLALENSCRGGVEDIAARLARYLPFIDKAPVVDLGCGRGEWLKLLAEHGCEAVGVDSNAVMLDQARNEGLRVMHADLVEFLKAAGDASFGAITAFQVIEHLDQNAFLDVFAQAYRVLQPGGVLVLETPNPENLQVAAYSFWQDPTHVRPLPPPLLAHTAAHFGFVDIRIERSNAWSGEMRLADDSDAARYLEKLLFCGQDYALIARKPHAEKSATSLARG